MPEGRSDVFVDVTRRDDGVAVVRLDRPKANALCIELLVSLAAAARDLTDDPPGAVVIWGGERIFAAGADIAEFASPARAQVGPQIRAALDAVAAIPRATIAAVYGYALGGGCELALACDFRVATPKARFGQPEILLGIIPGGGGTQRLARLVGASRAKDLILSGRQVGAEEALAMGLVDRIADAPFDAAIEWAASLARGPLAAHALAKHAIDAGLDGSLAAGQDLEQTLFAQVFDTEDAASGGQMLIGTPVPISNPASVATFGSRCTCQWNSPSLWKGAAWNTTLYATSPTRSRRATRDVRMAWPIADRSDVVARCRWAWCDRGITIIS
jgi:enoyl-CoA hydratase/carnithine racemase